MTETTLVRWKCVCSQLLNFPKLPVEFNSMICSLKSETSFKSTVGEKVLCFSGDFSELRLGGVSVWQGGAGGGSLGEKKRQKCRAFPCTR